LRKGAHSSVNYEGRKLTKGSDNRFGREEKGGNPRHFRRTRGKTCRPAIGEYKGGGGKLLSLSRDDSKKKDLSLKGKEKGEAGPLPPISEGEIDIFLEKDDVIS